MRPAGDGISVVQTVDSVLAEVGSIVQRTRELAVQYQNGTLTARDRAAAQAEADALKGEVARLAAGTRFNGTNVLGGGVLSVHVGAMDGDGIAAMLPDLAQFVTTELFSLDGSGTTTTATTTTTITSTVAAPTTSGNSNAGGNGNGNGNAGGNGNGNGNAGSGSTGGAAQTITTVVTNTVTFTSPGGPPMGRVDAALDAISQQRAALGAFQNRLEHALGTLAATHEQLVSAESRVRDADVAAEVVSLTRHRVLSDVNRALAAQGHTDARRALNLLAA